MGIVAIFITVFVLGDFVWWWCADRSARRMRRGWALRTAIGLFAGLQIAGLGLVIASRWAGTAWEDVLMRPWLAAVFIWHFLALVPWLLVHPTIALVRGIATLVRAAIRRGAPKAEVPGESEGISRREFIGAATVLAPALLSLAGTAAALPQLERFRLRRIEVVFAQLPAGLDGLTIAHVSDIHVGRFTHGRILERIVAATNELAADLILVTGDIINFGLRDLPVAIDLIHALQARSGVFACIGNHDMIENGPAFIRRTRAADIPLLVNETVELTVRGERLQLLGLRWGSGGRQSNSRVAEHGDNAIRESMRELLPHRAASAFPILLAHHPHAFDFAADVPLTLAGHTHGGQIMFNETVGFGPWIFRYWSGLYRHGERALVVSNGVGNWFPLRTFAPAEIVHLTLRRG